jgi:hypothetical protein
MRSFEGEDGAARLLARSPHLSNLLRLEIRHNNIGGAAKEMLRARFGEGVSF